MHPPAPPARGVAPSPSIALETLVGRLASAPGRIDGAAVQKALGLRSLYLAERLVAALDFGRRGFADAREFAAAADAVMAGGVEAKLGFLFRLHDHDGNGRLSREEFERMLHISLAEHELQLSEEVTTRMLDAVWGAGDPNGDGAVSFDEFVAMVARRPELQAQLAQHGVALLTPGQRARTAAAPGARPRREPPWARNTAVLAVFVVVYALVNLGLFGEAVWRYHSQGAHPLVQLARGCGACLNFNGALVLVPMLRHTMGWVRRRRWGYLLPVDDSIDIHRMVGEVMFGLALLHTAAHVLNLVLHARPAAWWSWANVTGLVLLWVFCMMWLFSRERVRRSGSFEFFHRVHQLYFLWLGLMLVHGPVFWMWVLLPGLGYAIERMLRAETRSTPTTLLGAQILPSEVTRLDIARPHGFEYRSGDYVFLRIPAIARHEWHPFTLTSAPEDARRLTVHVRILGNWTGTLYDYCSPPGTAPRPGRRRRRELPADREIRGLTVQLDGPYGTPSSDLLRCRHAVMIGAGIGVTPFASLLQSLWLRRKAPGACEVHKLHFVWLSGDQHAFEWFTELLSQLEADDREGLFDIHIYFTGARTDMAGGTLDLARAMLSDHTRSDVVTGLRARTHFGRPDFDALLAELAATPGLPKPEVFLCGPAPLARSVGKVCARHGLSFRHERF
jgi:predicted ferric reductase/Ca2+-binding EF-hand superfamily protein